MDLKKIAIAAGAGLAVGAVAQYGSGMVPQTDSTGAKTFAGNYPYAVPLALVAAGALVAAESEAAGAALAAIGGAQLVPVVQSMLNNSASASSTSTTSTTSTAEGVEVSDLKDAFADMIGAAMAGVASQAPQLGTGNASGVTVQDAGAYRRRAWRR